MIFTTSVKTPKRRMILYGYGQQLREMRTAAGVSILQVARRRKKLAIVLGRIELNRYGLQLTHLQLYAEALRVDPVILLGHFFNQAKTDLGI